MVHELSYYYLSFKAFKIMCDNSNAICLSKNFVHHSRVKHINIKHHFIFYYVLTGDFEIYFISPIFQLVDIDTKPLFEKKSLHPS